MTLADPLNIRESILDNLRHNPDGITVTQLVTLVERDTGAAVDPILRMYDHLERTGEIYSVPAGRRTTAKLTMPLRL